jgi:hypothetical protein
MERDWAEAEQVPTITKLTVADGIAEIEHGDAILCLWLVLVSCANLTSEIIKKTVVDGNHVITIGSEFTTIIFRINKNGQINMLFFLCADGINKDCS